MAPTDPPLSWTSCGGSRGTDMIRHMKFVLVFATAGLMAQAAVAGALDAKLWNGTWRLNVAASNWGPAGPVASETRSFDYSGGILTMKSTTKGSKGETASFSYSVRCDGKPAPIANNPNVDSISLTCPSGREQTATSSLKGRVMAQSTAVVSADGKHLTLKKTYVGIKGAPTETLKYDR